MYKPKKYTNIIKSHKLTKSTGEWIWWTVPKLSKNFEFLSKDKVVVAVTESNYYLDQTKNKICFHKMTCEGCSYNKIVDVYIKYGEIFIYLFTVSDTGLDEKLNNLYKKSQEWFSANAGELENIYKNLVKF